MCVWTKKRGSMIAVVLMATPFALNHCMAKGRSKPNYCVCITKTEKAESEAQRGKPKGTLESESRNAIL